MVIVGAIAFYAYAIMSIINAWRRGGARSWIHIIVIIIIMWLTWQWTWYSFLKDGLKSTKESEESNEAILQPESDIKMPDFAGWSNEKIEQWFAENDGLPEDIEDR